MYLGKQYICNLMSNAICGLCMIGSCDPQLWGLSGSFVVLFSFLHDFCFNSYKSMLQCRKSYKVKLPVPLTVTCRYNMQSQCIILSNRTSMYFAMKCWLIMWMRLQTMPILRTWINCGSHCTSICIFILFFTEHTKTVLEVGHIDRTPLILQHLTLNRTRFWVSWWHCFIIPSGQNTIAYLLLLLCWSLMRRWTRSKEHWQPTNHHHMQASLLVLYLAMKYVSKAATTGTMLPVRHTCSWHGNVYFDLHNVVIFQNFS